VPIVVNWVTVLLQFIVTVKRAPEFVKPVLVSVVMILSEKVAKSCEVFCRTLKVLP
jgi:hypothetical protein